MSLPKNDEPRKTNLDDRRTEGQDDPSTTFCARLTGSGRSAVAVVGVRGPLAAQVVMQFFTPAQPGPLNAGQIRFGNWNATSDPSLAESVVVTPVGRDRLEIHCHGGPAASARILADLIDQGARNADPFEWIRPATPLVLREAEQVLTRCLTPVTAAIAMNQFRGALMRWAQSWLEESIWTPERVQTLRGQSNQILATARWTTRLDQPFRVVLAGPTNVGKSSLLNALIGYSRSIATDVPGTTRDVLHADTVIDGLAVRLSDTAGIRETDHQIEFQGIQRARQATQAADCVIWVRQVEPAEHVGEPSDVDTATSFEEASTRRSDDSTLSNHVETDQIQIHVCNKVDLLSPTQRRTIKDIATSAKTGEGIAALIEQLAQRLRRCLPPADSPVVLNQRQLDLVDHLARIEHEEEISRLLTELIHGPS